MPTNETFQYVISNEHFIIIKLINKNVKNKLYIFFGQYVLFMHICKNYNKSYSFCFYQDSSSIKA